MPNSKRPRKNTTPLEKRKYEKGVIKSTFSDLKKMTNLNWSSWVDDYLPNILWAVACAGNVNREECLELFRTIVKNATDRLSTDKNSSLTHSYLSTVSPEIFCEIFKPIHLNLTARAACSALAGLSSLPDQANWQALFADGEAMSDFGHLAEGVMRCLDHQSQEATDVRWAKIVFLLACGRVHAPEEFLRDLAEYPHRGDMRKVRPSIRAFEIAVRNFEMGGERPEEVPEPQPKLFWNEMMEKTPCILPSRTAQAAVPTENTRKSITEVLNALCDHFMASIKTTSVDPRQDGAFGLAINMVALTMEVAFSPSNSFASGRILLRTIVENFITLKYLAHKDDPTIWLQYRNYGSGQTALAFLKNVFADEVPDSMDMERLEMLANEDAWLETKDIAIGNWANLDLRKMSVEAGIKDFYDSYYDWTSGFVHGHWGAVRDASFTICMNPLHRLHRVPAPGSRMPPVLTDCCKICNRALDEISQLYPAFKPRIDWRADLTDTEAPA